MIDLILAPEARPFAVALGVALALALIEILTTLLGVSLFGSSDNSADMDTDVDVDADIGGIDADTGVDTGLDTQGNSPSQGSQAGLVSAALSWLNPQRVPFSILLSTALTAYGFIGLAIQGVAHSMIGFLPSVLVGIGAVFPALPVTRVFAAGIGRIIPQDETEAVGRDSLIGGVATIIDGQVTRDCPGRAQIRDQYGTLHNVRVVPVAADAHYRQGDQVLLVAAREAGIYDAVDVPQSLS